MKKFVFAVALLNIFCGLSIGQKAIVAGPMHGYVELRTANIWVQFAKGVKEANIHYRRLDKQQLDLKSKRITLSGDEFNTAVFTLTALDPGIEYAYYISVGANKKFVDSGKFSTQALWQLRKPAPSFSFLAGSCAYFNQQEYDRPGKPYGADSSIFETMANEKAAFMLWTGDNWYTRYPDYSSEWGLHYRASRDRSLPVLKRFLKSMSHYAIWDDHDYGPNDANKSYVLKEGSRRVFMKYWANPTYGENGQGIYTMFNYGDVDFFLLDGRWFRSSDKMKDSVNGDVNKEKKMFGDQQMEWLKNALLFSSSSNLTKFRIIVAGSQVLNQVSRFDALRFFRSEFNELMSFLEQHKINGVLFLTGDRHHSEIIKLDRSIGYTLYDVTISPLTSSAAKTQGAEVNNAFRVSKETDTQNYGRFTLSGEGKERKLTVDVIGLKGDLLDTWSVKASELSY